MGRWLGRTVTAKRRGGSIFTITCGERLQMGTAALKSCAAQLLSGVGGQRIS